MKNLIVWLNSIINKHKALKRWRRVVTVLAAIMTFVTTYALILPAITVEKNKVEDVGGMYLEQEADTNDMLEENALEPIGVSIAAEHENAVTFTYADDSMTATAVFGTNDEIPAGAELVVTPIDPESVEYTSLSSRAAELLDKEFIYDVTTCSFYDFALVLNNVDVTPKTGLVDIQIIFHDNTVEHLDDTLFAGRFARQADDSSDVKDELVSVNPDESSVIELADGIITVLSLKGNDLSETDSLVGILAGNVDEEIKAAAAETDAEIPDSDDAQEESAQADSAGTDGEEAAPKVGTLKASGSDYTVTLTYDATSEIPEGASLTVSEIAQNTKEYKKYLEETKKAMGLTEEETLPQYAARFFDIKIMVGGDEFVPESGVTVEIAYTEPLAANPETEVNAVHFHNKTTEPEVIEANVTEISSDGTSNVEFTAEAFSVYGVVYTVDFHWEADGKTYEFSIPGGGFVSFYNLVEALGIDINDTNTERDEIQELVDSVESITFSDPKLVNVSKVEKDTTVGAIKDRLGLKCVYSEELTKEEIAEIDSKEAKAGDWILIAVKPFASEETLTVTMKNGDQWTVKVTDDQLKKTVITASGETYEIVVTYGEEAQIPDNAKLNVKEILLTDKEYTDLYNSAAAKACSDAEKQGIEIPVVSGARLFDIEIQGKVGKIEPSAPVQVSIRLLGGSVSDHMSVVHFVDNDKKVGAEVLESQKSTSEIQDTAENKREITEISFQADSFSVYTVVNVTDFSSVVGSDKKYALVSGIDQDPGATTGYGETWGTDYFTIIVNAHAMTDQHVYDDQNRVDGLQVSPVHAWEDGSVSYIGGNPVQWQFESAGNGKYYLSANGKYLQRYKKDSTNNNDQQYGWDARLVENRNDATQLTITVNSDGTILIYDDRGEGQRYYLHNEGGGAAGNEWRTRVFKFRNTDINTNSPVYRFRLCQESDEFDSFAARKVSVQNLAVNDSFLIYRKFEDSQGNEQLFALASDGTFVRVYDGGDTVYWRETNKNLYWNYRLEGNYYSIYSTNPLTNETVYINPMYSSTPKQTITTEPSRLTLIGRDNGDYGTGIENWDQKAYDYAGLHVTVNNQGQVSLSAGTRVAGTSDEFLFAVASSMPGETAETVDTVDSDSLGIKITMFDYGQAKGNYNAGDKLDEMTDVAGSAEYTPHAAHQLVKSYLESGLPSSKTKGAMKGLFTEEGSAVTAYKENVNHLFLQSYYDENGMFRYRSEDNYAYLSYDPDNNTITGTDFTVYRQAATPYPDDVAPGHTYYTHGHFMPYNDIDMTQNVSRLMNQYGNDYQNGQAVGELPVGDGRTYEDIYGVQGIPNFYTGMKMEANFLQPKDGKMENGDPMVFKFTGDDDMWVYIDGVLVLDIGGIHEPLSGTINFATGEVVNPSGSSLYGEDGHSNLKTIFTNVLTDLQKIPVEQRTQEQKDLIAKIQSIEWRGNTFADYSSHDFKAFYMERGAGASNLDIQFNLKVKLTDEFVVEKQIPDGIDTRFVNQTYKFRATYKDKTDNNAEKPLCKGAKNRDNKEVCTGVYYKNRKDDAGQPMPVSVDQDGYFMLKAGEAAVFKLSDENMEYTVKEVQIDSNTTEQVEINDQVVPVTNGTAEAAYARVSDRSQLNYKNHPALQKLNIIKHLLPANTQAGPGDVFEFRVYLESTTEVDGETVQQLVPYSYGPYYVTKLDESDNKIHYFTLTGTNNAPEDKGTNPVVCSTTGRSGSINSIPPEYTVVIPNLAVGTHFYIEERRDNIPAGYVFDHEELVSGTYDTQTLSTNNAEIISRILARDEKDHQVFDPDTIGKIKKGADAQSVVYNRKTYVNVQKQWLKTNGQPYTLEQARQLPGSTDAVITAELWKKKNGQDTSGETGDPVTVTFMVNTTESSEYRLVSVPVTIKNGSTLEFSLGANKTSQAQEIHTDPEYTVSRSSVSSNPKIQYSNGRQKEKWSKYSISGITADTTVYATFDAAKVSDDFVGLYIASMEDPGSSETPVEEKVADITLNNGNDWLQQVSMEQGYTYFLMNVVETGLGDHAHKYTFIDAPAVNTDTDGNLTLAVANKYHEPIDITVEKIWTPELAAEEENTAYVKVELHRYAKKTRGVLMVVLKDNYGAPIEGAVFKLYKDGVGQEAEHVTDVNGKVTANNLEPGTYYFKQISTPEGYSMSDSAPQTENFVVADNKTERQEKHCELRNQALETNGVATLTLLDNNGDPVQGAKYNLIKKDNNQETVIKEGLVTDENGQITVSQLKAGTYYFFETEPPADYNLPDNWQDTDFTVLERPGVIQDFTISMTNNLKGRGYVNVKLTGPEGTISGAKFELYKDGEKQAEATTDEDGNLTFGDQERLHAGTYYVKQISTAADLLPANQQSFTIYDNGNTNQKNELSFTNPYRGKGTATVTLTRKDNNSPISGAKFELYKDGEKIAEKTTNDSGQLTFGDPDKLLAGNYSVKQVTTAEGLEPVVNNWSFEILENGDPNQTYSWNVQNEEHAGNVTIKLWRKGGTGQWNWECVNTYTTLKPGRTYSFTAKADTGLYPNNIWYYQDESDHNNTDSLSMDQLHSLNSDDWDNGTYHFTITPERDDTIYSFVLVSGWGKDNIRSMTMDEASRQAASPTYNLSRPEKAGMLAAHNARLLGAVEDLVQNALKDAAGSESDEETAGGANQDTGNDAPAIAVTPSGPPSSDYIDDSGFVEEYTITKADNNWKHVFEDLDKTDQDENPYYYYVVETECMPETYQVKTYGNDNLTDTGTITITNEKSLGDVSIGIIKVEKGHKDSGHTLKGAKFQLTRVDDNDHPVSGAGEYQSDIQTVDPDTGKTSFSGLIPGGRYKLEEKEAPSGYVLVETPWYITVDMNGTAGLAASYTMASNAGEDNSFYIENEPGAALPNTGGPGTRLFMILGSILILGAGVLLWRRRRLI